MCIGRICSCLIFCSSQVRQGKALLLKHTFGITFNFGPETLEGRRKKEEMKIFTK